MSSRETVAQRLEGQEEAPGWTVHLLMEEVAALRLLYADLGISALLPDAKNIVEAWMELGHLVDTIKIELNKARAA